VTNSSIAPRRSGSGSGQWSELARSRRRASGDVLRQPAAVLGANEQVVSVRDDEGRRGDERHDVADVELEDRAHLRERRAGAGGVSLHPPVPVEDARA